MVECTLCALVSFTIGFFYNMVSVALEYRIFVVILSIIIAVMFVANFHTAAMLCDFFPENNETNANDHDSENNADVTNTGSSTPNRSATGIGIHDRYRGNDAMPFNYSVDQGPHTWLTIGSNQSPINIVETKVRSLPIRELLTWNHYDELPTGILLENTGHTVVLRFCFDGNTPSICGADLYATYTFAELSFRWSMWNDEGSEHMINYRKYPLEIQAVHRTGPLTECTSSYDLLIIGYFFEISVPNPYLEPLIENLHRIQKPGTKVEIPPFPLSYLCHQFRSNFYSYGGSITEPPCYQGAEWFIYAEPIAISELQLFEFRKLMSFQTKIVRNSRPVQNIHCSRVVNFNMYNPMEVSTIMIPENSDDQQAEDMESME